MKYKTFKVGDLFDCTKAKYTQPKELIEGDIPYVSRSAENNGVIQYCGNGVISKGQCITIDGEGRYAFWQDIDFVSGSNITVLRNTNLNSLRALYLCSIFNSYVDDYSYQNVRTLGRVQAEEIQLPVTDSGEPDWTYMEQYMQQIMNDMSELIYNIIKCQIFDSN